MKRILATAVALAFAGISAHAVNPYAKEDDTWISISGEIEEVSVGQFLLDYGSGYITVEMDDWDWYDEASPLLEGDNVTVYGMIDDDLFEVATIEANSVYVESLNSFFYANDVDEEDAVYAWSHPIVVSEVEIRGVVTKVGEEEFMVDTGNQQVRVEVDELGYNPLDDIGYTKIDKGDRVLVNGEIDADFIEGRELVADYVVVLSKDKKRKSKKKDDS